MIIFSSLLIIGCPSPIDNTPTEPEVEDISSVLKSLPEIKLSLPKSLQGEDQKAASRVYGDTTILSESSVQAVKSDAWYQLRNPNPLQFVIDFAFNKVKAYAEENDILEGEPFELILTAEDLIILFSGGTPSSLQSTVKVLVEGTKEDFTLYIYVNMDWKEEENSGNIKIYNDLNVASEGDKKIITVKSVSNLNADYGSGPEEGAFNIYITLDSSNGTGDLILSMLNPGDPEANNMIQSVQVLPDGSLIVMNKYSGDNVSLAWGNNEMRGIVDVNSWDEDSYSYHGEYYNYMGNLIYKAYGDTDPPGYFDNNKVNIYETPGTAPGTIYLKKIWVTDHLEYQYTDDIVSPDWTVIPDYGWTDLNANNEMDNGEYKYGFTWKQGADWSTGDVLYDWSEGSWSETEGARIEFYTQTYVIPTPDSIFGKNF